MSEFMMRLALEDEVHELRARMKTAVAQARREALEEAALLVDAWVPGRGSFAQWGVAPETVIIAAAIRDLAAEVKP